MARGVDGDDQRRDDEPFLAKGQIGDGQPHHAEIAESRRESRRGSARIAEAVDAISDEKHRQPDDACSSVIGAPHAGRRVADFDGLHGAEQKRRHAEIKHEIIEAFSAVASDKPGFRCSIAAGDDEKDRRDNGKNGGHESSLSCKERCHYCPPVSRRPSVLEAGLLTKSELAAYRSTSTGQSSASG